MSRLPRVVDLTEASAGWGFYFCSRKDTRTGRGSEFLALTLQDASGQVPAKVFEDVEGLRREFDAGEFVKVQGRADRHHGRIELVLDRIRRIDPVADRLDGFREDDCIPSSPRPIDDMWRELEAVVAAVEDRWLRQLLDTLVARHADRLRVWPAAVTVHHAYRGGLLEHILKVVEVGRAVASAYGADRDMVVAGAILHDLGKVEELRYEGGASYTRSGNLLGHITIGVMMVRDAAATLPGFPDDIRTRLEHLIASHHGARERGSPVEPMTAEAFILSSVDDLDARLHQYARHVRDDSGDGEFTSYHPRLGRVLLKPSGR